MTAAKRRSAAIVFRRASSLLTLNMERFLRKQIVFIGVTKRRSETVGVLVEKNVEKFIRRGDATTYAF
jgi:hypothetical protein